MRVRARVASKDAVLMSWSVWERVGDETGRYDEDAEGRLRGGY